MLARIANNLFWLGRYIKRAEVTAKFAEIEYLASLDAPLNYRKKSALAAMLKISGDTVNYKSWHPSLFDEAVLFHVTLDGDNPNSTITSMAKARESAMSARDILPLNVWEAINTTYHYVRTLPSESLKNHSAFETLEKIVIGSLATQTLFDRAMIRNEAWQFIKLGVCLESAIQSARIIGVKLNDIERLDEALRGGAVENYIWASLLRSLGSQGLHKSGNGSENLKKAILNTVILDNNFPQSIAFNFGAILEIAKKLEENRLHKDDSLIFAIGKLYCEYEYLKIEELLSEDLEAKLQDTLLKIYKIGEIVGKRYF